MWLHGTIGILDPEETAEQNHRTLKPETGSGSAHCRMPQSEQLELGTLVANDRQQDGLEPTENELYGQWKRLGC